MPHAEEEEGEEKKRRSRWGRDRIDGRRDSGIQARTHPTCAARWPQSSPTLTSPNTDKTHTGLWSQCLPATPRPFGRAARAHAGHVWGWGCRVWCMEHVSARAHTGLLWMARHAQQTLAARLGTCFVHHMYRVAEYLEIIRNRMYLYLRYIGIREGASYTTRTPKPCIRFAPYIYGYKPL